MNGRLIQQLNPLTVPSKRRNLLLADFFSRLGIMERRACGMKKIINTYKHYEHLSDYRAPEFTSNASEFHVTLWSLNFEDEIIGEITLDGSHLVQEFVKASRQIYKLISQNPQVSAMQMGESIGFSEIFEMTPRIRQDNPYGRT